MAFILCAIFRYENSYMISLITCILKQEHP